MDLKSLATGAVRATPSSPRPVPVRGGSAPGPAQAAPEPETSAKAAPPQTPERTLSISIDKETGRTVVHLIDVASGSVIRQIPTEEMLAVARVIARVQAAANQVKG